MENTSENMNSYYFAECRLNVSGDIDFIKKTLPDGFLNENPYISEITLNIFDDDYPECKNGITVSNELGFRVDDINGEKWLFSCTDIKNTCFIEATRDCSSLQCYMNPQKCVNEDKLKENFKLLLQTTAGCHLAYHNKVTLHSSFISYNGQGIIFTAPCGTGKSTQAEIWEKTFGAKIINGDRPFLKFISYKVYAYGVPWDGKEQIFSQESCPVTAVIEVRQAKRNSVRKMNENQAFRLMMKQCYIPMWDDTAKFSVFKTIRSVSKAIPFYRLFCLPHESAAELLHDILFMNKKTLLEEEQTEMKIKDGFVLKNIVDEWIVMPTGSNIKNFEGAIVLSEVAAFIWKQLEKPISREDLLQAVLGEYDIDEKTAMDDIDGFIEKLRSIDILTMN